MLGRVALVRTDVSEELSASFIRRNIPEGTIIHSHRRGNLKSYVLYSWKGLLRRLKALEIQVANNKQAKSVSSSSLYDGSRTCVCHHQMLGL
jgi:hypothetical protein